MKHIVTAIKENTSTLLSFIVAQLGMMIFGLVVIGACIGIGNTTLTIVASLFTIGFYLALLYNKAWLMGAKDRIRIDGGRLEPMPLKGLLIGALANLLNLVLAILANIGFAFLKADDVFHWGNQLYYTTKGLWRFLHSFYIGVLNLLQPFFQVPLTDGLFDIHPLWLLILLLPGLTACTAGYLMGSNNLRILGFFGIPMLSSDTKNR